MRFGGVGGHAMAAEGLKSLFPLEDIAVMGFSAVIARLPTILNRIRQTVDAVVTAKPDILVIIDSPDFTHRGRARRCASALPEIPIVDYVSPSVWAWRPGRARRCAPMSIICWRCCRSSRRRTGASAVRRPPMSAIR